MKEKWKGIVGYEGLYEASSQGRIRSLDRMVTYSTNAIHLHKGKILKQWIRDEYYAVGLTKMKEKPKFIAVHIIVATTFIPNPKNKRTVNHKNGNKLDNRKVNLEWNTHKENNNHARFTLKTPGGNFTKVKNTKTGETFDSVKEAYENVKDNFSYSYFVSMLNGRMKNKTNFKHAEIIL